MGKRLSAPTMVSVVLMAALPSLTMAYRAPVIDQSTAAPPAQNSVVSQQMVSSDKLQMNMMNLVTQMQQQLRELQGQLEVQNHQIEQLQHVQRDMYRGRDLSHVALQAVAQTVPATQSTSRHGNTSVAEHDSVKKPAMTQTSSVTTTAAQQPAKPMTALQAKDHIEEKQLYQSGYELMMKKQYSQATVVMGQYLQQYPKGQYAASTYYWLGEMALLEGILPTANRQFTTLVTLFPDASQVPDAKLKIGFIYYQQGKWLAAKQQLEEVKHQYPSTTAAQLADQRLQNMQRMGVMS